MRTLKIATEDKLHSAESAAELLGVRPSTIRWWLGNRRLPRLKIGRLSKVRESALIALIGSEQTPELKTREESDARA